MSLMEFPCPCKFHMPLLLLSIAITIFDPALATKDCYFPAIFNFGASNADTGGFAAAFQAPPSPNGQTFFHRPSGRLCDGRLIIDFMGQSIALPLLNPYLDSLGTNFTHGANFATVASTIIPQRSVVPLGVFSPFSLGVQVTQFRGGVFATLIPKEEYFHTALYTFDIGQNDLTAGFLGNATLQQVNASVPNIINNFTENVKNIYNLGARSFWIYNTGPIGCLPLILANFPSAEKDSYGCAKQYNAVAQNFNQKLKEALAQLRVNLALAAITYVDVYSAKYILFSNPEKYGFEHPHVACCGYGGDYNYNNNVGCGGTIKVNGTEIFVGSCENPSVRVIWDGIHYTEAANKVVFDKISTGKFSDPPIPLNMACYRNFPRH
ncbi:hypothetical protein RJT34_12232 [Clitoria ternatea]|uniref:Uncharacterized protein n=1 Tax=Clitoria ternatea TaxID=43366 RepID=A0AAN9PKR3_CLITE